MEMILETMKEYDVIIILAMMALILVLIVIQIVNKVHLNKLDKRYKAIFRNSESETIEDLIIEYGNRVEEILEYTKNVHKAYKGMDERISGCTQKVGMVRYKAFEDIGSDLSYSIALLDEQDTGVIITAIYGRNDSTTFAKPVDNGISKYDLSDEEQEAIERAQNAYEKRNMYRMKDAKVIKEGKTYSKKHSDEEYYEEENDTYEEDNQDYDEYYDSSDDNR